MELENTSAIWNNCCVLNSCRSIHISQMIFAHKLFYCCCYCYYYFCCNFTGIWLAGWMVVILVVICLLLLLLTFYIFEIVFVWILTQKNIKRYNTKTTPTTNKIITCPSRIQALHAFFSNFLRVSFENFFCVVVVNTNTCLPSDNNSSSDSRQQTPDSN